MPEKLKYLQKKHAQRYIEERGPMFNSIVQDVIKLTQEYLELYPEYVLLQLGANLITADPLKERTC